MNTLVSEAPTRRAQPSRGLAPGVVAERPRISIAAARLSIGSAAAALGLLACLHVLSPEFDPSWRMVSEYALAHYGFVLSVMFIAWGVSSWALAAAVWRHIETRAGRIGLWSLVVAGLGEVLAAAFDITHDLGHNIAGLLGMGGLPVAAVLISLSLNHTKEWGEPVAAAGDCLPHVPGCPTADRDDRPDGRAVRSRQWWGASGPRAENPAGRRDGTGWLGRPLAGCLVLPVAGDSGLASHRGRSASRPPRRMIS